MAVERRQSWAAVFVAAAAVAPLASSNPPPTAGVPSQCLGGRPVTYVEKLDDEAKAYFWADTQRAVGGHLVVTVPVGYLDVISHLRGRARPVGGQDLAVGARIYRATAVFEESPHRVTRFFKDDADRQLMLTTWRFVAAGARLCIPMEFLNGRVSGHDATVSLAMTAMRSDKVVWKVTWVNIAAGVQNELYVEDRVLNGAPSMSPAALVPLAEALAP